jgi:hypothetical protein
MSISHWQMAQLESRSAGLLYAAAWRLRARRLAAGETELDALSL